MDSNLDISLANIFTDFKCSFHSKSQEEQFQIIQSIIASSDGFLKWRIKAWLAREPTPDLLTLLPPEIQLKILEMVDGSSLLRAVQVSRTWFNILKSHKQLWKVKSVELGVNIEEKPPDISWNRAFSTSRKQLHYMEKGTAFKEKFIYLQNCKKSIKAIDYYDGYLCAVSDDDRITIWQLELNYPVLSFLTIPAVSCIKFKPNSTLVCGHFSGILTSWDLSDMTDLQYRQYTSKPLYVVDDRDYSEFCLLKMKFTMHSGPVFSCDFSESFQLLISGSADESIKFWCLTTGLLLHNLPCQNHWILKVILIPSEKKSVNSLVCMTRESVDKYDWKCNKNDICEESDVVSYKRGKFSEIELVSKIKLNQNNDNFITPGLQMSSKYVGLVKQDLQEKQANLVILHATNFETFKETPLNFKVRKLLAIGNRFALLLTVGKVLFTSTLVIVDIINGKEVGNYVIPHSKMTTPDGAQIIVGDTRWLDGLTGWNKLLNIHIERTKNYNVENSVCNSSSPINKLCEEFSEVNQDFKTKWFNKQQACNASRNLILAAGIQDDVGRVFTLWWKADEEDKRKVD